MQVISGPLGRGTIHFEAPPADWVPSGDVMHLPRSTLAN
jgi:hypothetical protein